MSILQVQIILSRLSMNSSKLSEQRDIQHHYVRQDDICNKPLAFFELQLLISELNLAVSFA